MALKEFLKLVWSNLVLIILLPLFIAAVSAVVAYFFLPNEYTSFQTVYVVPKGYTAQNITNEYVSQYGNSFFEFNNELAASQLVTNDVAKLVKSNRVREGVIDEVGLKDFEDYKVEVESSEKNRIIYIKVIGKDPIIATNIVDAYSRNVANASQEVLEVESVNIIDSPTVPEKPSGPLRWFIVLVSAAGGLLLTIFIIYLKELLAAKIKSTNDLKKILDIPVLAKFPKV